MVHWSRGEGGEGEGSNSLEKKGAEKREEKGKEDSRGFFFALEREEKIGATC